MQCSAPISLLHHQWTLDGWEDSLADLKPWVVSQYAVADDDWNYDIPDGFSDNFAFARNVRIPRNNIYGLNTSYTGLNASCPRGVQCEPF